LIRLKAHEAAARSGLMFKEPAMSVLPSMIVAFGAFVTVPATLLIVSGGFVLAHWARRRALVRAARRQTPSRR
jgi:hypothetical protein